MADSSGTTRSTASVDERIVEAKFDTSDFEKGVDKTIKKLDELKESLNLKDAGKSIGQVAEETKKATEKASDSLNQLEKRLTTFTGILKQQFLTGIADQIVGVFFKMEHAITGFAKSMTIGMADAGRAAYEQMLTSVRMITNAFKRDKDGKIIGHYEMDEAYDALEKLKSYADETSYSMDQMTDAMSKMVAAGVPLEDAAKNVQGIANACANAGVNATDASRAFFNLSQAYSSGSLKYTDYRSLELLNMTNEAFKQSMLDAGVAAGTLKKIKDGQYQTIKAAGSKITAGKKVNMQNLSESLKYGWMNTKGMDQLFGNKFYADIEEITDMLYKQGMSMKEVLPIIAQKYGETAANAFKAAREARSFTDVLNTMKGIASAGWSNIWENMFGKLDEATEFFTDLADGGIANAIRDMFSWTNKLLDAWANGGAEEGGRDAFKETLLTVDELVGQVNSAFMTLLPNSDDAGYALKRFTQETRDNVKKFQTWLTEAGDDGESRLDKLVNVARIFSQTFGVVFYALGQAFKVAEPVLSGAFTILDKLIEPLSQLGKNSKPFDDITASITNLSTVLQPLTNFLGEVLSVAGDVAAFFFSGAIDTAIMNISFFSDAFGLLLEVITGNSEQKNQDGLGVIGHITNDINTLKETCEKAITSVKEFFTALFADLRKILGISQETTEENEEGGFFSNVINFFDTNQFLKDAEAWVQQAKTDVENWIAKVPENITNFATRIQQAVFGLFYTKKTKTVNTTDGTEKFEFLEETDFKKSLDEWWENTKKTVTDFIVSIPGRMKGFANQIYEAVYSIFYDKQTVSVNTASGTKNYELVHETEFKKNLDAWWESTKESIKQFIASIPGKIQEFFNSIPNLWQTVSDFLFGEETDANTTKTKNTKDGLQVDKKETVKESMESGLNQWLDSVRENILNFIKSIPSRLADLGKQIYEAVYGIFYEKQTISVTTASGTKNYELVHETEFKKWIYGIRKSIEKWLKKLPKITLKDLWNRIFISEKKDDKGNVVQEKTGFAVFLEGIFGEEQIRKAKENIDGFVDKISGFIENVKTTINNVWDRISKGITTGEFKETIKGVFDDIVNFIASLFTGTTDVEANADWFSTTVANAITWIKTKAEEAWPKVRDFIADIPNKIAGIFKGESSKGKSESAIGQALESFGKTVGGFIADLPSTLVTFFTNAINGIDTLWQQIYDALSGESQETSESSFFWNRDPDVIGNETKTVSKWETFIKNLGTGISNAFAKFPTWISQGLELALKGVNWVLQKLTSIITPEAIAEEVSDGTKGTNVAEVVADAVAADTDPEKTKESSALAVSLGKIGQTLIDLITKTIPAFIVAGFEAVKAKAGEWWGKLADAFQWNEGSETGEQKSVLDKIADVAGAIRKKIEDAIPDSVKQAFENMKNEVSEWWNQLGTVFQAWANDEQGKNTLKAKIGAIGLTIKGFIEKIPEDIRKAIASIGKMFEKAPTDNVKPTFSWIHGYDIIDQRELPKSEKSIFDQVVEFIDGLMKKIGEYAKGAFGIILPFIIDGWNGMIDTIGKFISTIGNLISGDKSVEDIMVEVFGEDSGKNVASHLNTFMGTITGFFQETIPNAFTDIKAAIDKRGGIGGMINSIFGNLFPSASAEEAQEEAEKAGKQTQEVLDEAYTQYADIYDKGKKKRIKLFFNRFGTVDFDKTKQENADIVDLTLSQMKDVLLKFDLNWYKGMGRDPDDMNRMFGNEQTGDEGGILGFINKILGFAGDNIGAIGEIALIVVGAKLLVDALDKVKDVLSITDEMDEVARTVKWTAIGIGIGGLIALVGKMIELSERDDGGAALKTVTGTLDTLVGLFERVGEVIKTIGLIKTSGSLFEMFGSFFDYRAAKNELKNTREGIKTAGKIAEEGGGFLNKAKNLAGSYARKAVGILGGGIAASYLSGVGETVFDNLAGILASIGIGIQNSFTFISPAVAQMATLSDDLGKALDVMDKLQDLLLKIDKFVGVSDDVSHSISTGMEDAFGDDSPLMGLETRVLNEDYANFGKDHAPNIINRLKTQMDFFFTLSVVLKNLSDSIRAINEVDDVPGQMVKFREIVEDNNFKEAMTSLFSTMEGLTPGSEGGYTGPSFDLAYAMSALSSGLSVMMTSLGSFEAADIGKASRAVEIVDGIFSTFAGVDVNTADLQKLLSGNDSLAAYGRQVQEFGGSITSFFTTIHGLPALSSDNVEETKTKAEAIVIVAKGLAEASDLLKANNIKQLDEFGEKIPSLGGKIGSFIDELNKALPESVKNDILESFAALLSGFGDFAAGLGNFHSTFYNLDDIPDFMEGFILGLARITEHKEELVSMGKEIAVPLLQGIQYAFEHPEESGIELKITPVLSVDQMREQIESSVKLSDPSINGLPVIVPSELYEHIDKRPDYSLVLSSIHDDVVSAVNTSIDSLASHIDRLQLYLDGNKLVGGIMPDIIRVMAAREFLADKGIVLSDND